MKVLRTGLPTVEVARWPSHRTPTCCRKANNNGQGAVLGGLYFVFVAKLYAKIACWGGVRTLQHGSLAVQHNLSANVGLIFWVDDVA